MYEIDSDFINRLEAFAAKKENDVITEMIESTLTKAVIVSSLEMLFSDLNIEHEKINVFADKLIKSCKDNDIPVIKGIVMLTEGFTYFAEMVTGDRHE